MAADLQSNQGLESAPGSGSYTIKRRGFSYAIAVTVCSLDDPRDGTGAHSGSNFCSDSSYSLTSVSGTPTDPDPEDYKRVVVQVLRAQKGNIKATANALGISRTTLYKKIRDYRIDAPM